MGADRKMIVKFMGQTSDLTNVSVEERERELNRIFKSLYTDNNIVQEVTIDGVTYREHYDSVLKQRLSQIQNVVIHTIHGDVLVQEMLQELRDYLPRVARAIESISDLLYGEMSTDDWSLFSQLLEGIGWVDQAVQIVLTQLNRSPGADLLAEPLAVFNHRLPQLLSDIEGALERKEYVEVADLMKYEIGELIRRLEQSILARVNI